MRLKRLGVGALVLLAVVVLVVAVTGYPFGWQFRVWQGHLGRRMDGSYLVSTNQLVSPIGRYRLVQYSRPKDLAVSRDREHVAVLCTGQVRIYSVGGNLEGSVEVSTAAVGVCWAPAGDIVYVSGGDGRVHLIAPSGGVWKLGRQIPVDVPSLASREAGLRAGNPQLLGLAASGDGKTLYVALGTRNAVAVVDTDSGAVTRHFKVGVAPYRLLLHERSHTLFVANRGGAWAESGERTALSAGTRVAIDRRTDAALRGSISVIDLSSGDQEEVSVGRQPSGMDCTGDGRSLYVADSDSDTVSLVDTANLRRSQVVDLKPSDDPEYGRMPTDVALSADEKTVYVTCGGINAVAALSAGPGARVLGYIPSGWFPVSVVTHAAGLVVACSKGIGSRPADKFKGFGVHDSVGLVQFAGYPKRENLGWLTRRVANLNFWKAERSAQDGAEPVPVPLRVGEPSVFKHVIYIIKENLTYDIVLGDMAQGNGDRGLCIFGEDVTPNHHKLAREFVLLDNTYTSGTNSADGHQWTSSSICNAYQEQNYAASQRSYPFDGGDPLAYSPQGFLWTAVARAGMSVRVYGEFVNKPRVVDARTGRSAGFFAIWDDYVSRGNRFKITAHTDNAALRPYLHPNYIGFPSSVSDQWRADTFLKDFHDFERQGNLPSLCMLLLPNNHTAGTGRGVPTPRAMVADNDLALGRIVEAVTRSRYWRDTLILVIEDDSQTGLDHVDGHRTAAFCISAYTRRGRVIGDFFNHASFVRTIELVLGVPAMNRFDRTAWTLGPCFHSAPNYAPFYHMPNNVALNERNPAQTSLTGEARRVAALSERQDWRNYDRADPTVVAKAAWYSQRPNEPFPTAKFDPTGDGD